jgi:hypothetical protein
MPNTPPAWLPDKLDFDGNWERFLSALYAVFTADFKSGSLWFRGCPVWYIQRVITDDNPHGYEEGFWHLVTRNEFVWNPVKRCKEKQRLPDIGRACYLPWGRPTVERETAPEVLVWDFEEELRQGKVVRTYLWLKDFDYLVILERQAKSRGDVFLLITTFLVDAPGKKSNLESKYSRRKK